MGMPRSRTRLLRMGDPLRGPGCRALHRAPEYRVSALRASIPVAEAAKPASYARQFAQPPSPRVHLARIEKPRGGSRDVPKGPAQTLKSHCAARNQTSN